MNTKEIITTRVLVVGSLKSRGAKRRPRIRVAGFWLSDFGFNADTLVSGEFDESKAIFKAEGTGIEAYNKCISDTRQKGGRITQVSNHILNKKMTPYFDMTGHWLEGYGFNIGDVVVLHCSQALIEATRLDLSKARGLR